MIRSPRGVLIALGTACIGLSAAIGAEIFVNRPQPAEEMAIRPAPPFMRTGIVDATVSPEQHATWFQETVARPLFSPDRRPTATDAHRVRGLPRLTGIIVNGARRVAIFAAASGGAGTVVEAGSRVGAYEVKDVTDAGVTVIGPEGVTVIRPIFDPGPPIRGSKPAPLPRPEIPKPTMK